MSRCRIVSCTISLMAILLGGCGVSTEKVEYTKAQEWLNENPIDISQAIDIPLNTNGKELSDLLHMDCCIERSGVEEEADTYVEIGECARNEKDIFYVRSYGKAEAQYYYLNQIYRYDSNAKEDILLYETSEAVWLNEFLASNTYLYWIEYINTGETSNYDYNVMQYDLSTEEVNCIASRNAAESDEICLAVSDEYVTWYDGYQNKNIKIVVYDVARQELQMIEDASLYRFMPYERLNVVDGGVTYFSKDAEGRVFINRYNLKTHQKDILFLGEMSVDNKLAACFSNEEYIGWLTEYSYGTYYFYHMETGKLYSLKQSDEIRVFSGVLSDCLYINDSINERVYVYNLETEEGYYQDIEQGYALSLKPYGENRLYTKVVAEEYVGVLTVQSPAK